MMGGEFELTMNGGSRRLQETASAPCSVCGLVGGPGKVLQDTYPKYDPYVLPTGLTCEEVESSAAQLPNPSSECSSIQELTDQCCNITSTVAPYECETTVQNLLLGGNYTSSVAPVPLGSTTLNISVHLSFFHLSELSTVTSTAQIYVGLSMWWIDERLRWDPESVGGCYRTFVRASLDVEKTSIWVPDYDLLNRVTGVRDFEDMQAEVTADGTVAWFRLGGLKALCVLTGLEQFPYDTLGCGFNFGSVLYPSQSNFFMSDGGLLISDRHKANYHEFTIVKERASVTEMSDNQLRYQFYFERSSRYYTQKIVVPTILFTLLSFGMFLLDIRVGERLAFGKCTCTRIFVLCFVCELMWCIMDWCVFNRSFACTGYCRAGYFDGWCFTGM